MNRKSQKLAILSYLQIPGNSLTHLDALALFKCARLGARAFNLREDGYDVRGVLEKTSSGKWVARYRYYGLLAVKSEKVKKYSREELAKRAKGIGKKIGLHNEVAIMSFIQGL